MLAAARFSSILSKNENTDLLHLMYIDLYKCKQMNYVK